ncbi:hypothetical protein [Streptomyces sp. NPDC058297]|uniref:hypothetical protein n=1 Tax=unclassified Streptomyces TaxID=2593676 RepID=UPI0036EAD52B
MTDNTLNFFDEVCVTSFSAKPELEGTLGAVLGISEPCGAGTPVEYGVMLDDYGRLVSFRQEHITPTGRIRSREDYY